MKREAVNLQSGFQDFPFSHAIKANGFIFCSGQIPMDIETGKINGGDIRTQTRQVLENLRKVLMASGSSLEKAVKLTVFMTDLNEFQQMNEVYREFFRNDPPARSTIQVNGLAMGVSLEIELVALE
jgi:2-iminobutanoate/2-iminopropanoate deaminase